MPPKSEFATSTADAAMPSLLVWKARHVAVAALLAKELELVALVGRQVRVVTGELDGRHGRACYNGSPAGPERGGGG
jgi:hypothetical protein